MERLTYWNQEYNCWSYSGPSGEAAKRLAAYENTITLERAQELIQAEKDGRLMVLPVKEGTKIYQLGYRLGGTYKIEERFFNLTYFRPEEFGKTLFLTREEAEAALKKKEEANNETVR